MKQNINHADMVAQLAKPGADIITGLTPLSAHLLHMAVGISGEVGELIENNLDFKGTRENAVEEFGDIEFYFEGLVPHVAFISDHERIGSSDDVGFELLKLAQHSGALLDAIKKSAFYVKELDTSETVKQMDNIRRTLSNLYYLLCITREEAIEANISKLGKRYKGHSYSDQQAQDRADKDSGENLRTGLQ